MKCKLSLIVDTMDRTNMNEIYYLNKNNCRILVHNDIGNYYIDNNEKVNDDFLYDDSLISLPDKYQINEYKIVKKFIDTIKDETIKNQLLIIIQGKGAFRRFKDSCINYNIIDKWYDFRNIAYYELAKEWCSCKNITFDDDVKI